MAAKKIILFEVEIQGSKEIIQTREELTKAIKATNDELKNAKFGTDEYLKLSKTLAQLQSHQKDATDAQRLLRNEFEVAGSNGTKTYRAMNAELGNLRAAFRELTKAERDGEIGAEVVKKIQLLDKELKDIDASIGNFQRNVGNYEGAFEKGFAPIRGMLQNSVPGFAQLDNAVSLVRDGIDQVGQAATRSTKLLTGAFIGFQVASMILEGVKAIQEFSKETNLLRGNIGRLSKESEQAVRNSTSSVMAIVETFGADQEEALQAANAIAKNYGVTFEQALAKIESGFLAGANANGKWLDAIIEMAPKAKGAGASLDQFTVALAESGRAGLQEEEMIEGVIKRSNEFSGTLDDLIDKTDALTQKQIAQLAADKELAEAKVELSESLTKVTGASGTFFTQLETVGIKTVTMLTDAVSGLWNLFSEDRMGIVGTAIKDFIIGPIGTAYDAIRKLTGALTGGDAANEQARKDSQDIFKTNAPTFGPLANTGKGNQALTIAQQIAGKQAKEDAKRAAEERRKMQQDANAAEARYYEERIALLNELSSRLAQAGIDAIQDQTAREIAEENNRFARVGEELAQLSREQEAAQLEARLKLVEAYGPNSSRVREFDQRALADIQARREQAQQIEQQELQTHLRALEAIRADAIRRDSELQLRQIQSGLEAIRQGYAIQANADAIGLEQAINQTLQSSLGTNEKNELIIKLKMEAEKSSIQQQVLQVDEEIKKTISDLDSATNLSTEGFNELNTQLDALNLKRAQLERQYTEIVISEEQKRRASRANEMQAGLQNSQQILQIFDTIGRAFYEAEIGKIQEREDANAESIARIEKQLQSATGTQKVELEKQLANEKANAEKIAKEKERIEKEEGQRAKAFAIAQSIISTALAVVRALATPPAPNIFAASLAGGLGLAQTAVIAAQPAAEGGRIGTVPEQDNGLIVTAQNIPQLSNGDNVLATLKRGEVVLNRKQQAMLGGAPTFRAMRVPGFAEGGAAGSPISAPDLSGITSAERLKQLEANQDLLIGYTKATNERIDRIQTFVVSEDVQTDLSEGNRLKTLATLG